MHIHLLKVVELIYINFELFSHLNLISRIITVAFSGLNRAHGCACMYRMIV